jgi:hypothetical protein
MCILNKGYFCRVSDKHIYYKNTANIKTSCDLLLRFVENMRERLRNIAYWLTFRVPTVVTLRIEGIDAVQPGKGLPTFRIRTITYLR